MSWRTRSRRSSRLLGPAYGIPVPPRRLRDRLDLPRLPHHMLGPVPQVPRVREEIALVAIAVGMRDHQVVDPVVRCLAHGRKWSTCGFACTPRPQ